MERSMGIKKSKGYDHLTNLGLKPGEIDMHMHSTASDRTDSPGQLALKAREAELTFLPSQTMIRMMAVQKRRKLLQNRNLHLEPEGKKSRSPLFVE